MGALPPEIQPTRRKLPGGTLDNMVMENLQAHPEGVPVHLLVAHGKRLGTRTACVTQCLRRLAKAGKIRRDGQQVFLPVGDEDKMEPQTQMSLPSEMLLQFLAKHQATAPASACTGEQIRHNGGPSSPKDLRRAFNDLSHEGLVTRVQFWDKTAFRYYLTEKGMSLKGITVSQKPTNPSDFFYPTTEQGALLMGDSLPAPEAPKPPKPAKHTPDVWYLAGFRITLSDKGRRLIPSKAEILLKARKLKVPREKAARLFVDDMKPTNEWKVRVLEYLDALEKGQNPPCPEAPGLVPATPPVPVPVPVPAPPPPLNVQGLISLGRAVGRLGMKIEKAAIRDMLDLLRMAKDHNLTFTDVQETLQNLLDENPKTEG